MLIVTKQPIPSEKSTNGRALRAVTLIFLLRMLPRMECETYELKCKTHRKYEKPNQILYFWTSRFSEERPGKGGPFCFVFLQSLLAASGLNVSEAPLKDTASFPGVFLIFPPHGDRLREEERERKTDRGGQACRLRQQMGITSKKLVRFFQMDMFSVATYKDSTTSLLERNEAPLDVLTLTSLSNGLL